MVWNYSFNFVASNKNNNQYYAKLYYNFRSLPLAIGSKASRCVEPHKQSLTTGGAEVKVCDSWDEHQRQLRRRAAIAGMGNRDCWDVAPRD